jgi:hypothetical protein
VNTTTKCPGWFLPVPFSMRVCDRGVRSTLPKRFRLQIQEVLMDPGHDPEPTCEGVGLRIVYDSAVEIA